MTCLHDWMTLGVVVIVAAMFVSPVLAGVQDAQPTRPRASEIERPEISGNGGDIPVRLVAGRLVISCDISGPRRRLPMNLWLDLDGAYGLQLHNRAAAPLPAETGDGQALPLTLHFPDFTLRVPQRELGDEEAFEDFTKYHSAEIGENALVGALGAHYLKHFDIVLDLPRNRITLRPAGGLAGRTPGVRGDVITVAITEQNDLVWIPVRIGDDHEAAAAIGTLSYDTLIDTALCDQYNKPAGDVGMFACRTLDFAKYVALRPEEVLLVHPDGVAGVIGLNALQSLRVEIDRVNRLAVIEPRRKPIFPDADLAFFQARASEDAAEVETWLDANADERLAAEAAELLLTWRLEEMAGPEETGAAVKWINDTTPEDLRATRMLDLMEELSNEGEMDLVIAAGRLGVDSGREDRYPDAVHKLHSRLGEVLLDRGEDRDAWRHLLSAAFGLPEDGMINLNLGRYYEKAGRYRRAFSRYIQAVIKEESGPQAMEGMQRIDTQMPDDQRLSLDVIERMIAGKVRNYGAPLKFEPSAETPTTNRTVLVEFFTNAFLGDETRGAIGGALGNQGLTTHFDPEFCTFLSYHLPAPKLDPLVNEVGVRTAELLRVDQPAVQVVDGVGMVPGAGRWRDAEAIYKLGRDEVLGRLRTSSDFDIEMNATLVDGRIRGTLSVFGPSNKPDQRVQLIVAERGVIFPGSSGVVIHRMLARGSALGAWNGLPFDAPEGEMTLDFECVLAEIEQANAAYLDELEASGAGTASRMGVRIDPDSVVLVAIVRDGRSGFVRQVLEVDPDRPRDDVPGDG